MASTWSLELVPDGLPLGGAGPRIVDNVAVPGGPVMRLSVRPNIVTGLVRGSWSEVDHVPYGVPVPVPGGLPLGVPGERDVVGDVFSFVMKTFGVSILLV